MRIKLLFIQDGKINRKLNQVKLLQTLRIIDFYQLYSSIFIN